MTRLTDDFLPDEYIEHRQDRRMHILAISLLLIVLSGVGIAFLAKQADWYRVRDIQSQISLRYEDAADQVRILTELESRQELIAKRAELAASLIDRLPRSVLLARFINHMPDGLGLLEFDLTAARLPSLSSEELPSKSNRPARAKTVAEVEADPRVEAPRWRTDISMLGFAPTDVHVSALLAALKADRLLQEVSLQFSEETTLNDLPVRQFHIKASIGPDGDCRTQKESAVASGEVSAP